MSINYVFFSLDDHAKGLATEPTFGPQIQMLAQHLNDFINSTT